MMVDLPGPPDRGRCGGSSDVVRECGAEERVYYCAGAGRQLAVRAADPTAEIALTWTTLAPPRAGLLAAVRPRWLNYRFGLVDPDLAARVHRDGCLLSVWTPDTRRSMRRLLGPRCRLDHHQPRRPAVRAAEGVKGTTWLTR